MNLIFVLLLLVIECLFTLPLQPNYQYRFVNGHKCPDDLEVKESECLEAALGVGTLYNLKNELFIARKYVII